LSTRENFAQWLSLGKFFRGWARSVLGEPGDGLLWIEDGMREYRETGGILCLPYSLAMKAEALDLADRTSEALEAIKEAEALMERSEDRWLSAELYRLRGVFLTRLGVDEVQIEDAFCKAVSTANRQKSVSLERRAEATYAEYRRQKARGLGGRGFRLPLC
jgi:predicted ATPase